MKTLAILVGANPKKCNHSPIVRLGQGAWKIVCDGLVNTRLTFKTHLDALCLDGDSTAEELVDGMIINGISHIRVIVAAPGSEQYITIKAELQQ